MCTCAYRCELCGVIFNIRMLPTSVNTNVQTIESFVSDLVGPHTYVHLYARYSTPRVLAKDHGVLCVGPGWVHGTKKPENIV